MSTFQRQVNARIHSFVDELSLLARHAAFDMLTSALAPEAGAARPNGRAGVVPLRARHRNGKRTSAELAAMADSFLTYVAEHPGQRMESITAALGYSTQELTLPVKKLLLAGKIRVEGQKRATSYFAVTDEEPTPRKRPRTKRTQQARRTKRTKRTKR
ncbi:hypothetical protein [Haliangium sp.]|uniref:hypothetical protein n=1 Tax=Haliangium sp. TaxID=2663208 RepID=UPI003D0BBE0B